MIRAGLEYTLAVLCVTAVVGGAGTMLLDSGGAAGALIGVGAAFLVQTGIFWGLLVRADVRRIGVAHGVGVLLRFVAVGVLAFLVIPAMGIPPAATLLSLVTVFFVTTLLEPVFLKRRHMAGSGAGATTIQTEH